MAREPEGQGLIARVTTALRYAVTGNTPDSWFGPLNPLPQQAPEEVRGRAYDFQQGINLNFRPRGTEPIGFVGLKQLATYPIVAMLIQRQKDKVGAVDWKIKPRVEANGAAQDDRTIAEITAFFHSPDKEHDWVQWIGGVVDQQLVIDAVSIYAAPARNGSIYGLQVIDGATIKPILSFSGRRPIPPETAYQEVIKGIPAIDYTSEELTYFPRVWRVDRLYGYSPVEQARDLIDTAILRLQSQKGYFDFGNVGDGYFSAPEGWTPDQITMLESKWNSWMQGSPAVRRSPPFVPAGTEWHPTKVDVLADQFDEFLIRLLCFPFGVPATPFMKQAGLGHGSAQTDKDSAEEGGVLALLGYIERLCSHLIAKYWQRPDLEFSFVRDTEIDPKAAAEIDDVNLRNGSAVINEVRDRRGEAPLPNGDKPMIYMSSDVLLLEDAIKPKPEVTETAPPPGEAASPAGLGKPVGDNPDGVADAQKKTDLNKAAHGAAGPARTALKGVLAQYLAAKGAALAEHLAGLLGKAAAPSDGDPAIEQALSSFDWEWSDLEAEVEPILAGLAVAAGQDAISSLGLFDAQTLKLVSERATAYARDRSAEMVGMKWVDGDLVTNPDAEWSIAEATRDALRTLVTNAVDEGQSTAQLASSIGDAAAFSADRADMIARTETAYAQIRGAAAGWIESGVVSGARFDASPDCCDECQAEDGTEVELTEPDDLDLPHPNCRCSWSAILAPQPDDAEDETED